MWSASKPNISRYRSVVEPVQNQLEPVKELLCRMDTSQKLSQFADESPQDEWLFYMVINLQRHSGNVKRE